MYHRLEVPKSNLATDILPVGRRCTGSKETGCLGLRYDN